MSVSSIWIEDECTACGACVDICPELFEIQDIAVIKEGLDLNKFEEEIIDAAENCPVDVIKFE